MNQTFFAALPGLSASRLAGASALALFFSAPAFAQVESPARAVSDPAVLESPVNPDAVPVPVEDLSYSRTLGSNAWSQDGSEIFLVTNLTGRNNIWKIPSTGGWPVQLTRSEERQGGLVPSHDGRLLYYTQDVGGDEQFDIYSVPTNGGAVRNLTNTPELREVSLVIAPGGTTGAISTKLRSDGQVNLALINLATGKTTPLVTEPDPVYRWAPIAWVEGGKALIASRSNANSTVAEVWRVEVPSGTKTLLLGKEATLYEAADATADGRLIAVSTNEGTGQLRAGIYDTRAKVWRWLAPTPWEQSAGSFSPDGKTMTVTRNEDGRTSAALVDLTTLAETPVPLPAGVNYFAGSTSPFSPDGSRILVVHSGADTPSDLQVVELASGKADTLTAMGLASLKSENLPKSRIVTYKSFDGTLVSAIVTMPFNLARDGTNPAVLLPHGGPTGQSRDGFNRTATALASRGYIVMQPNVRGSTGYGQPFQNANYQDLGGGDLRDVIAGKQFLVESGYVDPAKVGITGGSYGGYMTLIALAKTPEEFAAGAQLFGIINWFSMYETSDALLQQYLISLLGDPVDDRKVYESNSPITYIRDIKAPLLSLQGDRDIRVPRGQAEEVAAILAEIGTPNETVFYADEGHGFAKRENQIDSLSRVIEWFDRHLKAAAPK
ncbi:S9 family peptidase [Erythrobacter sp. NFXS35]|uniref:S9 family peptidase n=1 Tax=Erythrobacter sp. NFXS35 TaxID=2818436 RepID=UPI0032DFDFE6